MRSCLIISVIAILASCSGRQGSYNMTAEADTSAVSFAQYLSIKGDTITSTSSWDGVNLVKESYHLVPRDCTAILKSDVYAIPYPVESCIAMSTTYLPHLKLLGAVETVKAASGTRFIYDSEFSKRAQEGKIVDIGAETAPDYEQIISLGCDVILSYGIAGSDNSYIEKLRRLGQKVLIINDYLESSPMARLEYLKLFGALTGKRAEADSIFTAKENAYNSVALECKKFMEGKERTKVLINIPFKDVWYLPGEESYMARLISDAGGTLLGAAKGESSSTRESFEKMYSLALQADVWINQNSLSKASELSAENPMFKNVPCFKSGKLFNNIKRVTPKGGSDFWESGAVNPEVILSDLIKIFHPDMPLASEEELYYYIHLE